MAGAFPCLSNVLAMLIAAAATTWASNLPEHTSFELAARGQVSFTLGRSQTRVTTDDKGRKRTTTRPITMRSADGRYTVTGYVTERLGDGKSATVERVDVGMPQPASANWYHGGFLRIFVNGKDLMVAPPVVADVVESGERGVADWIWDAPPAAVRLRFMMLEHSDHLLVEIAWTPELEIKSVRVQLTCYPSFFTSWHKRTGARRIATPSRTLEQGHSATLVPARDWYLVYYDEIFDPARGEGDGPCALLFVPDQVVGGSVNVGGYAVTTTLDAQPKAGQLRLALWDFKGRPNADALEQLRAKGAAYRDELAGADFRSRMLRQLDLDLDRRRVAHFLAAGGRDADVLRGKWNAASARLRALQRRVEKGDWLALAELLKQADAYRRLMWDIKFHRLLAD